MFVLQVVCLESEEEVVKGSLELGGEALIGSVTVFVGLEVILFCFYFGGEGKEDRDSFFDET